MDKNTKNKKTQSSEKNKESLIKEKRDFDRYCKDVLAWKDILGYTMLECVSEFKGYTRSQVIACIEGEPQVRKIPLHQSGPKIKGDQNEDIGEGNEQKVLFDIRFTVSIPGTKDPIVILINVEMQTKADPGYPLIHRGMYYAARMISSQYQRGVSDANYKNLKKVYSIWIILCPNLQDQNAITVYEMQPKSLAGNVVCSRKEYDKMCVVFIYLGEAQKSKNVLLKLLDDLMGLGKSRPNPAVWLQKEYGIVLSAEQNKEVTEMKYLADAFIANGIAIGKDEGRQEGRQEGRREGKQEEATRIARNMYNHGMTIEMIADTLEVSQKDVREMI